MTKVIITGAGPISEALRQLDSLEVVDQEPDAMRITKGPDIEKILGPVIQPMDRGPKRYRSKKAPRKWWHQ